MTATQLFARQPRRMRMPKKHLLYQQLALSAQAQSDAIARAERAEALAAGIAEARRSDLETARRVPRLIRRLFGA